MVKFMSTKKSTKTARRNNKKKNKSGQSSMSGSTPRLNPGLSSTAASYEVVLKNPSKFRVVGSINHKEYGSGLKVTGCQQHLLITTTASNSQCFVNGTATASSVNASPIAPGYFNDRIAQFSALYQRYAFKKLRFYYVTRVGTTQVGSFCLAYTSDGGYLSTSTYTAPTYGTLQSMEPSKTIPFRKEIEELSIVYNGDRTWLVAQDVNASAYAESFRQCFQGYLLGYPDITSIGAVNMGELYVEYELDLYGATNINTNITLLFDTETKNFCQELFKKFQGLDLKGREVFMAKYRDALKCLK